MTVRLATIAAGIASLLLAAPATSSDVLKLRVGQHATYTRIVFELDLPTGYRVKRETTPDGTDIVVTLDASADGRHVKSGSSLVRGVTLASGTGRSVARIHLRDASLPLKEMMLRDPARIVLDVMGDDKALARVTAAKEKARAKAKKVDSPTAAASPKAPKQTARSLAAAPKPKAPTAPEPKTPPAPSSAGPKMIRMVKPEPTDVRPEPRREAPPKVVEKPAAPKPVVAAVEKPAPAPKPTPAALEMPPRDPNAEEAARAAMQGRVSAVKEAKEERVRRAEEARAARQDPKPAPAERAKTPPVPRTDVSDDAGFQFDPVMAGAIAGAILVVLVVVMMLRRRRSLPKNLDVMALAEEGADDERIPAGGFSMDLGEPESPPVAEFGTDETTGVARRDEPPLAAPGLFDEAEKGEGAMDQVDLGMDTSSQAPTQPATGAATSDVSGMLAEFERRIAQLEGRLDEAVEARERLERQVAAQSEELRVQRAAIARTQRALRGMSRSDEEQATEPALRDPS